MSASTGAISARTQSRGGSVRWAVLVLVVVVALAGGVLLGRAIAPSAPQTAGVTQRFVPSTAVETLPSDAIEQATLKAQFGRSLTAADLDRVSAPSIPVPKVDTPRTVHWHKLAP